MKIKREIETTNAKYELTGINEEQFRFIHAACSVYFQQRQVKSNEAPFDQWYEVYKKLEQMTESSVTVIK